MIEAGWDIVSFMIGHITSAHPFEIILRFGFSRVVLQDTKGWPATGLQSVLLPGCGIIPRR